MKMSEENEGVKIMIPITFYMNEDVYEQYKEIYHAWKKMNLDDNKNLLFENIIKYLYNNKEELI